MSVTYWESNALYVYIEFKLPNKIIFAKNFNICLPITNTINVRPQVETTTSL